MLYPFQSFNFEVRHRSCCEPTILGSVHPAVYKQHAVEHMNKFDTLGCYWQKSVPKDHLSLAHVKIKIDWPATIKEKKIHIIGKDDKMI